VRVVKQATFDSWRDTMKAAAAAGTDAKAEKDKDKRKEKLRLRKELLKKAKDIVKQAALEQAGSRRFAKVKATEAE
jgi:cytochrome c oxidase subunit II